MLRIISVITSITVMFFFFKGFNRSKDSNNDKKWVNAIFIQYMLVFGLSMVGLFVLIYRMVTNQ